MTYVLEDGRTVDGNAKVALWEVMHAIETEHGKIKRLAPDTPADEAATLGALGGFRRAVKDAVAAIPLVRPAEAA